MAMIGSLPRKERGTSVPRSFNVNRKGSIDMDVTSISHRYEQARFCALPRAMAYDGTEDFAAWQAAARTRLAELLCLPTTHGEPALSLAYTKDCDGYTEHRFTVETEPGYLVPCHLLLPQGASGAVPLTLCLSGHGSGMHVALGRAKDEADERSLSEWPHRAMAPRALREGRAALVIEARGFGEASITGRVPSCTETAKIALLAGRTLLGERVFDAMRILDAVLSHFPTLDREGIVCTGNSGGGTVAYYLACLDERIAVAAPSCSICNFEFTLAAMPHCLCNHVPGIRRYFELSDLGGLIAPRALVIAAGRTDTDFPAEGTERTFEAIRALYATAGAPRACTLVFGEGGHYNYADLLWAEIHRMGY